MKVEFKTVEIWTPEFDNSKLAEQWKQNKEKHRKMAKKREEEKHKKWGENFDRIKEIIEDLWEDGWEEAGVLWDATGEEIKQVEEETKKIMSAQNEITRITWIVEKRSNR